MLYGDGPKAAPRLLFFSLRSMPRIKAPFYRLEFLVRATLDLSAFTNSSASKEPSGFIVMFIVEIFTDSSVEEFKELDCNVSGIR